MKDVFLSIIKDIFLSTCFVVLCLILASINSSVYSKAVHPHDELALVGYQFSNGVHSALCGFFVRNISMRSHFMAKLERDTFGCAGIRLSLSTNPFQLCHPHLVVIGKAPLNSNGAHSHA
ncbi:hypothetical protein [Acinetobacter sp. UBA3106]|uniref:hypothetical protein n=1 Tax=Acinetobacter sp. UBA3106 TaxID=1945936 RepID=UPI0025B847BD|nr:hypothetical protein [Acinetobacter sp. UBA3106]